METAFSDQRIGLELASTRLKLRASIIIVNYNSGGVLARCIKSLVETNLTNLEIVVVDNASTDGSLEDIRNFFPQVRWIISPKNLGFGGACNLGARAGKEKYLAFLNPDTVVTPGWLDALIAALEDDPKTGLVTPKILLLPTPDRINTCGNDVHISGLTLCRGMGSTQNEFNQKEPVEAVSGAAFVIRRKLFEQLGGFDESFFLYMEDTDLSWRARLAGWQILYVPLSRIYHDYKLCFGPRKIFYQECNRYSMLLKCLHWRSLLALLPTLLLAEFVTWGFCLLHDQRRIWEKCRAYACLVSNWQAIMQARLQTQALRRVPDEVLLCNASHRLMFEQTCSGLLANLAHRIFDPLFAICKVLALLVVQKDD